MATAALCTALVLGGCSPAAPPDEQGATSASVPVDGEATELSVGGVSVSLALGRYDGAGELELTTEAPATALPDVDDSITPVAVAGVTLTGARLTGPAQIRFDPPDLPDGAVPVVFWEDGAGGWDLLPHRVAADGSILARTRHFSWGFLGSFDPVAWIADHGPDWGRNILGRAGADQPACGDERAPRDAGIQVVSDSGDPVKWCFGIEDGQQVLKVTNNKTSFIEVTYPSTWSVREGQSRAVSPEALARSLGSQLAEASTGRAARVIDAADTLTLLVPDGVGGRVTTSLSTLAWALTGLAMGLSVYGQVASLMKAGGLATTSPGTLERVMDRVAGADLEGYEAAFRDCGLAISQATEYDDNPDASFATIWTGCIPALMKADVAATGLRMWAIGAVMAVVATAVTAVYTAGSIISSGLRELYDTAFTPKDNGANVYRIKVVLPEPSADGRAEVYDGLVVRRDGDTLTLAWLDEFHRPCFHGTGGPPTFIGEYGDLERGPATLTIGDSPRGLTVTGEREFYGALDRTYGPTDWSTMLQRWPSLAAQTPDALLDNCREWLSTPAQTEVEFPLTYPGVVALGASGLAVRTWQEMLIAANVISDLPENRDGVYGPGMEKAVREYQQQWGLVADGVAGTELWNYLAYYLEHRDL